MAPIKTRPLKCWSCGVAGYFAVSCKWCKCWLCKPAGHLRRNCPGREGAERKGRNKGNKKTSTHSTQETLPRVANDELLLPAPMSRLRNRDSQQGNKNKGKLRNRNRAQIFQLFKERPDFTSNVLMGHKTVKTLVDT